MYTECDSYSKDYFSLAFRFHHRSICAPRDRGATLKVGEGGGGAEK